MKNELIIEGNQIIEKVPVELYTIRNIISNRYPYRYDPYIRKLNRSQLIKLYTKEVELADLVTIEEDFITLDPGVWYYCEYYDCHVRFKHTPKVSSLMKGTEGYSSTKLESSSISTSLHDGQIIYMDYQIAQSCTVADPEKLSIVMEKLINLL